MKTKTTGFPRFHILLAWTAFLALAPAFAQTGDDAPPDMATPPRLAIAEGDVQFWRSGNADWQPARINTALAAGDAINTGNDAAVELQIGPTDFVRLPANTLLTLENSEPNARLFHLTAGTASFDLRGGGQFVRIDTDNVNIAVAGSGYYRILVHPNETRITVRNRGSASITLADGRSRSIASGEEVSIKNGGANVDSHAAPALDVWDNWNTTRTQYYASSESYQYVSPDVYGAVDLDYYGSWSEDNTYGSVWVPAVASDWTPYSVGYWNSDPYFGWTWIDAAPWGWTTSHYGRWVRVGPSWGWAPGPRRTRVVYAPALVAFFDGGGGMGWVALGWGEPLVPWWGHPGFRGTAWWGGWAGPRVNYRQGNYVYRNTAVTTAVVSIRINDFGRAPVRGSNFSMPASARRPVQGQLPVRYTPAQPVRSGAMPSRPKPVPHQGNTRGRDNPTPVNPTYGTRPSVPKNRPAPQPVPQPTPQTQTPRVVPQSRPTQETGQLPQSRPALQPQLTPQERPAMQNRPAPTVRPAPQSQALPAQTRIAAPPQAVTSTSTRSTVQETSRSTSTSQESPHSAPAAHSASPVYSRGSGRGPGQRD
jgi:hypothetical protein